MFVDAVMANVLVFAVGQVFAWLFLRSGRFWVGAGATVALWTAIDWWLVQRYVLATPASSQQLALLILQATAALTTVAYLWAVLRKRLAAPQRADRFREGLKQLLAGEFASADTTFRKLVWADPWDPSAWIARGDACRRLGTLGRARRCYRRAGGVDVKGQFADLLAHRLQLLRASAAAGTAAAGTAAAGTAAAGKSAAGKSDLPRAPALAPPSGALAPPSGALAPKTDRADRKRVRNAASGS